MTDYNPQPKSESPFIAMACAHTHTHNYTINKCFYLKINSLISNKRDYF